MNLESKYYERDLERHETENDKGMYVCRQKGFRNDLEGQEKYDKEWRVNCKVLERTIENPLGMDDFYYYYVVYRDTKQINTSWSRKLDLKKYQFTVGLTLPFYILKHIEKNGVLRFSELIVATPFDSLDNETIVFYTVSSAVLSKFFLDHRMPTFISPSGETTTGLPKELLKKYEK